MTKYVQSRLLHNCRLLHHTDKQKERPHASNGLVNPQFLIKQRGIRVKLRGLPLEIVSFQKEDILKPFPTCRRVVTHQNQTTIENVLPKGEIAPYEQFIILTQYVQLYSIIINVLSL